MAADHFVSSRREFHKSEALQKNSYRPTIFLIVEAERLRQMVAQCVKRREFFVQSGTAEEK